MEKNNNGKSAEQQNLEMRLSALYKTYMELRQGGAVLPEAVKATYTQIRLQIIQYFKTLYGA